MNIVTIMPRITAEVSAPAMPWMKRAAMSISWLCAAPHSSDATVNTGEAAEEHGAAADQVAESAGQQQQAAEGDQVRVHDPGEA